MDIYDSVSLDKPWNLARFAHEYSASSTSTLHRKPARDTILQLARNSRDMSGRRPNTTRRTQDDDKVIILELKSPIHVDRFTQPNDSRVKVAAEIAADALFDPVRGIISCLGCSGDQEIFKKLHLALARGTAKGAHLFIAIDDRTGHVIGTISAYAPGTSIMGHDEQQGEGFADFLKELPPNLRFFWEVTAPNILAGLDSLIDKKLGTTGGKLPAWAVNSFAVKPDWRLKKVGKTLLKAVEDEVRRDEPDPTKRMPILCEASNKTNIKIAKALGFDELITVKPEFPQVLLPEFTILRKNVSG
ncbi:uncharacterized protein PHACADRAFT_265455 [Phanerochaete carnosa HHB-10118-sp]|uniref:N-acetyltransferase domain-containing protein n=1 Tax=Phanerochaete carnosa (strain HHB-10118-sp) TaxID=650164 RepID=K5UJN6_PHACS|nr:uncharacterized protein PHACADRAFT_265455 [Phanerochaete carnosa HHB-10118-sp]EKM49776.1 hypothetical protein PHACADRAFT_265455 [Phanerochaete carnosa HHB-10118-sp]